MRAAIALFAVLFYNLGFSGIKAQPAESIFSVGHLTIQSQGCPVQNETGIQFKNVRLKDVRDKKIYFGFQIYHKKKEIYSRTSSKYESKAPVLFFENDAALTFCIDTKILLKKKVEDLNMSFYAANADTSLSLGEKSVSPHALLFPGQQGVSRKTAFRIRMLFLQNSEVSSENIAIWAEKSENSEFVVKKTTGKSQIVPGSAKNLFRISQKNTKQKNLLFNLEIKSFSAVNHFPENEVHLKYNTSSETWKTNTALTPLFDFSDSDLRMNADILWDKAFTNPVIYAKLIDRFSLEYCSANYADNKVRTASLIFKEKNCQPGERGQVLVAMLRYKGIPSRLTFGITTKHGYQLVPEFFLQDTGWVFISEKCQNMICTQTMISDYVALVRDVQAEHYIELQNLALPSEVRLTK